MKTEIPAPRGYAARCAHVNALREQLQAQLDTRVRQDFTVSEALRYLGPQLRAARRAVVLRDVCLLDEGAA